MHTNTYEIKNLSGYESHSWAATPRMLIFYGQKNTVWMRVNGEYLFQINYFGIIFIFLMLSVCEALWEKLIEAKLKYLN